MCDTNAEFGLEKNFSYISSIKLQFFSNFVYLKTIIFFKNSLLYNITMNDLQSYFQFLSNIKI